MKKLRWGIMGCAQIAAKAFIPSVRVSDMQAIAAVASRDEAKARSYADTHGIPGAYGSYQDLLTDPNIDAVYIPLPNHLHREWTIEAARAGKHVLVEKPMAVTASDAAAMVEACERFGVHLQENVMYRCHPRYDRIKDILRSGEIGTIRGVHGVFTSDRSALAGDIRFVREMGGGSLYDIGCYLFSAARYLLETEPVAATAQAFFSPDHGGVDMMASGLVEFPGDAALTYQCGLWADFANTLEIRGTRGTIRLPSAFSLRGDLSPDIQVTANGETRTEPFERGNQQQALLDGFARAVLLGEPEAIGPWDGVRNLRVIEASLTSAREKRRVTIEPQEGGA
ncbi:Gfo/Idh/MocA family oxidoreductase [Paenibacillus sp. MWE-103]|uniref:Gfo/Idh/MocA family oxidoreductase n=1 Tax=Paenibacillus artemisiicola TaxID=1172618 RepID=A0ABS3W7L6_9BACL|nr:Gfo/Idh/MocA family oxidoreductase [Paenibacillus artemisiicola]MBO7744306.1 Gfo/Idh/MocA family oxidoreductase [Paenibacillus artemisiicola]